MNGLGIEYGLERSFKLTRGRLLTQRFLAGFHKAQLGAQAHHVLAGWCRALHAPAPLQERLFVHLAEADLIHLGFEESASGCVYKLYLEFLGRVQSSEQPLFLACKWSPEVPAEAGFASYTAHRRLRRAELHARVAAMAPPGTLPALAAIVDRGADRCGADALLFLDVSEEGNQRRSFDLNLYPAQLTVDTLAEPLHDLARALAIPPLVLDAHLVTLRGQLAGHVSAGHARDGSPFATLYHGAGAARG